MGIYISNIAVEWVELAITLNLIIFYQTYMCVFSLESFGLKQLFTFLV